MDDQKTAELPKNLEPPMSAQAIGSEPMEVDVSKKDTPDDSKPSEVQAKKDDPKLDGPVDVYYKDSTIKQMSYTLQHGKLHGEYLAYDEKGAIIQRANYLDGEVNGEVVHYTSEGKLAQKFTMLQGKIDGTLFTYTDGILTAEMTYKNGVLNGPFVSYHQTGGKSLETLYIMGKLEGPFVTYSITGKKVREMSYKEGKPSGECIDYYEDGTTVRAKFFHLDGFIEGLYTEYHKNGVIAKKQGYKGGKPIGDPINYNESGKERPKEEPKVQSAILKLVGKK